MAADKACWKVVAEETDGGEMDRDGDADRPSHLWLGGSVEGDAGGSAERRGSDLTQAGLSEGTLYAPCLPCPQRGPRRTF